MSELLTKSLADNGELQKVIQWLQNNDITVQKHGISTIEFARYFLEFLRRHTRLLLPTPEQCSRDITKESPRHLKPVTSTDSSPNRSHNSTFNSRCSTPLKTVSTPTGSKFTSPIFNSRTSTPFNSTGYNTSGGSNLQTLNCSPNSMQLLEKRLVSKDTKQYSLEDFIVTKEKQSKQKKKKRASLMSCDSRLPKNADKSNDSTGNVTTPERSMNNEPPTTPISTKETKNIETSPMLNPVHSQLLRKLALIYSAIITSNLIQDLLKELNYLMSLLTSETNPVKNEKKDGLSCRCSKTSIKEMFQPFTKEICIFRARSDGVFFVCVVLEDQWNMLKHLNKSTLQTLREMPIISTYLPEFASKIGEFVNDMKTSHQNINILNREMLSATVKFQMDTDCRSNYASDELFYAFKKQRDEFYSLLHEWEDNSDRQLSSIEFFKSRYKKLRQIFSISSDCTNMFRLADLFVSQILASVFNENVENCEKLSASGIPLTKFDLLNRRFVTPCSIVVGFDKRFPGVQEFFKDFLRSSSENAFFLCHVRDTLVQRIISLNNFQFSCEVSVALERQELFLVCINKLCLLAKFLSLITFLPYQDRNDLPLHRRIPFAEARKDVLPPLDLDHYLTVSITAGRMVVTIPWIVEFLNGIDSTSILLPYYKTLLAKLQYLLYRIKLPSADKSLDNIFVVFSNDEKKLLEEEEVCSSQKQSNKANTLSARQIRELATRTQNDFNRRLAEECLQTISCAQILITLYVNSLFGNLIQSATIIRIEDISSLKDTRIAVSSEFYIGETTLYQCCPQLYEIKSLLQNGNKLSYKSIIPQTEKTFCEQQNPKVAIDVLMEAHLFSNMPKTVKSCVDFVAERIASNCVKEICKKLIPTIRTVLNEELRKGQKSKKGEENMASMLTSFYSTLKRGVKEQLAIFSKNIEAALRALIEAEVAEENVMKICVDIACRKCIEIVYNWIFNYINFNDMLAKERAAINEETDRQNASTSKIVDEKKSKKSKSDSKKIDFDEWMEKKPSSGLYTAIPPVNALHNMRHLIRRAAPDVMEKALEAMERTLCVEEGALAVGVMEYYGGTPTQEEVMNILSEVIGSVESRPDLQFIAFRRLLMTSLEAIFVLVFYCPHLVDNTLLEKFNQLWSYRKVCKLHLTFELILCPRNVDLLSTLTDAECRYVRRALTTFLVFVINNNLLHVSRLYSQLLRLLRRNWDPRVLNNVSECLKQVLNGCNGGHKKISYIISWIADYIEEDDFD